MKYIVSVVMVKKTPGAMGVDLKGNIGRGPDDIDIQNVVGVTGAADAKEAEMKVTQHARLQYPEYKVVVRVVVQANETDLED
jgi:hypothetical protein